MTAAIIVILAALVLVLLFDDTHQRHRARDLSALVIAPRSSKVTVIMRTDARRADLFRAEADLHQRAQGWVDGGGW